MRNISGIRARVCRSRLIMRFYTHKLHCVQWKGEVANGLPGWSDKEREHVGEELSDVLIYLISLEDKCGVDLSRYTYIPATAPIH